VSITIYFVTISESINELLFEPGAMKGHGLDMLQPSLADRLV
jgi:hypothetical protein